MVTPPRACETHSHIYGPADKYPQVPGRKPASEASIGAYETMLSRLGFERCVIVQPSLYGTDNRCTLNARNHFGLSRARGVAVTKKDITPEELLRLHDAGVRGLRFYLIVDDFKLDGFVKSPSAALRFNFVVAAHLVSALHSSVFARLASGAFYKTIVPVTFCEIIKLDDAPEMARRIAPLGWHLQIQDRGKWLLEGLPVLEKLPVDVVVDHLGRTPPENGVNDPGFQALLHFLETGRCWVKISAPYLASMDGPPHYADVGQKVRSLVSVRPDRLVWAANWPHPHPTSGNKPEEADYLDALLDWVPDEKTRKSILVDNSAKLYDFNT